MVLYQAALPVHAVTCSQSMVSFKLIQDAAKHSMIAPPHKHSGNQLRNCSSFVAYPAVISSLTPLIVAVNLAFVDCTVFHMT